MDSCESKMVESMMRSAGSVILSLLVIIFFLIASIGRAYNEGAHLGHQSGCASAQMELIEQGIKYEILCK